LRLLTEVEEFVKNLTKTYAESLIKNLDERFKEKDLLLLRDFDIFDPQRIPSDDEKRAAYGDTEIERFPMVGKKTIVIAHWHSFLEHAVHDEALYSTCQMRRPSVNISRNRSSMAVITLKYANWRQLLRSLSRFLPLGMSRVFQNCRPSRVQDQKS